LIDQGGETVLHVHEDFSLENTGGCQGTYLDNAPPPQIIVLHEKYSKEVWHGIITDSAHMREAHTGKCMI
jgi:hypothetical protein